MIGRIFFILMFMHIPGQLLSATEDKTIDYVVAIVNDDVITKLELDIYSKFLLSRTRFINAVSSQDDTFAKKIFENLILQKIQLQLACELGIKINDKIVIDSLKQIANGNNQTLDEFQLQFEECGISFDGFREFVKAEMIISSLQGKEVNSAVVISTLDIDNFLTSSAGHVQIGTEYCLGHIIFNETSAKFLKSKEEIKIHSDNMLKEVRKCVDFTKLVGFESVGTYALHKCYVDWYYINEIPSMYAKYVPSLQMNEVFGPIYTEHGFHIIKLIGKRIGKQEQYIETRVRQTFIKTGVDNYAQEYAAMSEKMCEQNFQKLLGFYIDAKQYSENSSTGKRSWNLDWITKDVVLPKIYEEVQKLKYNEISQPFKTDLGWHLVQVLGTRIIEPYLKVVRMKAVEIIREVRYQKMLVAWLNQLRDSAYVEVLEKNMVT